MEMNAKYIRNLCRKQDLYLTPDLNDTLYLHFKGFSNIGGLDEYTGLKVLWLEGNAICKIENLDKLIQLRHLYLHENLIGTMENLDSLVDLDTLNLSNNHIETVRVLQGLKCLTSLKTLLLTCNKLSSYDDLIGLLECPSLQILDLGRNLIEDPRVLEILEQMPNLRVLNLLGNSVVGKIKGYRKMLISRISTLTYLDDMPVFENERRLTAAWVRGGHDGEVAERKAIRLEEEERDRRNFEALERLVRGEVGLEGQDGGSENGSDDAIHTSPSQLDEESPLAQEAVPSIDEGALEEQDKKQGDASETCGTVHGVEEAEHAELEIEGKSSWFWTGCDHEILEETEKPDEMTTTNEDDSLSNLPELEDADTEEVKDVDMEAVE